MTLIMVLIMVSLMVRVMVSVIVAIMVWTGPWEMVLETMEGMTPILELSARHQALTPRY